MSAALNPAAEADRLRKTIALAEEAIKIAADHRSARHAPGETETETWARWNEAGEIETAALACRKAARSALRRLDIPRMGSPEQIAESIAAAKAAALALKAACDAGQEAEQRRRVDIAAAPAARHPLDGRMMITAEQAATLLRLLRDPAASALVGWQSELTPEEMAEHIADLDVSLRLLGSPDTFATLKRFHR
jgi:hypothetical protein